MPDIQQVQAQVERQAQTFDAARKEMGRVLVGQKYMVDRLLIGLLANGHVLIEGVPGLAKTTAVKALAEATALQFARIQFTPDLLPADLLGTQIYQPATGEFSTRLGPMFANILLADEINRAPPKVQSALLEAMQERQVTLGDQSYPLPYPFLVLATQNPVEQEGTYPLPEAQMDRFILKLSVTYPSLEEELEIISRSSEPVPTLKPQMSVDQLVAAQRLVRQIKVTDVLMRYIVDIVRATREPGRVDKKLANAIEFGASPRASIALAAAARAHAFLEGRPYANPEDVKAIGKDVLRHRILPTYEAEADGLDSEKLAGILLDQVDMP
ncbi:MAG: MoxR family ATPase [Myxococcota bacterium]